MRVPISQGLANRRDPQTCGFWQPHRIKNVFLSESFIWISLIMTEVEHLFICLNGIWTSFSVNFLFLSFSNFLLLCCWLYQFILERLALCDTVCKCSSWLFFSPIGFYFTCRIFFFLALFLLDKGIFIVAFINFWMASGFSPKMLWFLFILHLNFSSIRNLS